MQTSGLFTLHTHEIKLTKLNDPLRIVFFGDVHRDSPNHARDHWRRFLDYARGLRNAVFFGMGDYLDATSSSEREILSGPGSRLHETTKADLAELTEKKIETFAHELEFMRGRLIGLLNGNHYFDFQSGINSDQKLCEKLGCKFLGVSSFVRLAIDTHGSHSAFDIWAHHGAGGSRLIGGSINRVDQMREHAEADCYVMGHDHRRAAVPANPRMCLKNSNGKLSLQERQQWLVRSGSFLKSYEDGRASYNVDAARGPCSLGHVEIELTPRNSEIKGEGRKRWFDVRGIA